MSWINVNNARHRVNIIFLNKGHFIRDFVNNGRGGATVSLNYRHVLCQNEQMWNSIMNPWTDRYFKTLHQSKLNTSQLDYRTESVVSSHCVAVYSMSDTLTILSVYLFSNNVYKARHFIFNNTNHICRYSTIHRVSFNFYYKSKNTIWNY